MQVLYSPYLQKWGCLVCQTATACVILCVCNVYDEHHNFVLCSLDGWFHCMCAIIMGSGVCTGNLHQPQYCDKIKSIVEFLNTKLSLEELSTIWEMQVCAYCVYMCPCVCVGVCLRRFTCVCGVLYHIWVREWAQCSHSLAWHLSQ